MPDHALSLAAFSAVMALAGTGLALPVGVGLGWLVARRPFPGRSVVETIATLPLVMPPVATGLILLRLFGRRSPVGRALDAAGIDVIFTWKAVVLAMAVMSVPIILLTAKAGFQQLNPRFEQMAATLGASPLRIFFRVSLPLASRSLMAAALLGFARALGEFGATIMVAGGIPGETETLAVAIYRLTEIGREDDAMGLLVLSVLLAFGAMFASNHVLRRQTA
ncbi:MAG: molybdate ABC transporter permease subunit [Acidobacteriota bacterium]